MADKVVGAARVDKRRRLDNFMGPLMIELTILTDRRSKQGYVQRN